MKGLIKITSAILLVAIALLAISCNAAKGDAFEALQSDASDSTTTEANTEKKTEKSTANADTRPELSVLFIGNSYTYYNSLASIFRTLAAKAGYRVKVSEITKGGYTLEKFADPSDAEGKRVADALDEKNAGKYDFVILQ